MAVMNYVGLAAALGLGVLGVLGGTAGVCSATVGRSHTPRRRPKAKT